MLLHKCTYVGLPSLGRLESKSVISCIPSLDGVGGQRCATYSPLEGILAGTNVDNLHIECLYCDLRDGKSRNTCAAWAIFTLLCRLIVLTFRLSCIYTTVSSHDCLVQSQYLGV